MLDLTRPRPVPARVDVVLVGGGLNGVALLHRLTARGMDVALLERDRLAAGGSGRGAGLVLQGVAPNYAAAVLRHGRDVAREVWEFTAESHHLLRAALPLDSVRYARRGSLTLAAEPDEAMALEESAALLTADGFTAGWQVGLPPRLSAFEGGLLNPLDGELDAAAAVRVLADRAGLEHVHEGVAVEGCDFGRECATHTSRGVVRSNAVVLATEAEARNLAPTLPVRPLRGQMLASAPVPDSLVERPVLARGGTRCWRQLGDGRVVVGELRDEAAEGDEREAGSPQLATTPGVQDSLDRHLREVIGVTAEITHRWAGVMGITADELPIAGRIPGVANGYVAAGFAARGLGFAFNCARVLADLVDSKVEPPAWLAAARAGISPAR